MSTVGPYGLPPFNPSLNTPANRPLQSKRLVDETLILRWSSYFLDTQFQQLQQTYLQTVDTRLSVEQNLQRISYRLNKPIRYVEIETNPNYSVQYFGFNTQPPPVTLEKVKDIAVRSIAGAFVEDTVYGTYDFYSKHKIAVGAPPERAFLTMFHEGFHMFQHAFTPAMSALPYLRANDFLHYLEDMLEQSTSRAYPDKVQTELFKITDKALLLDTLNAIKIEFQANMIQRNLALQMRSTETIESCGKNLTDYAVLTQCIQQRLYQI